MAIFNYKKFQILLRADSKKTQGLQTGDIVRRQYFDGKNVVYSLMCVLSYGVERRTDKSTGRSVEQPYFIGALLEGDAPKQSELLDFARITNLFNVDRSGALYLTSSDSDSPFMDVIDNLGRLKSLSWPENISGDGYEDPTTQYIVSGKKNFQIKYSQSELGQHRIVSVQRTGEKSEQFEGLKQDFYQFVENPNRVLISYKIKSNKPVSVGMSLGYSDDLKKDGEWVEPITTEWQYKFHAVTVDYSGRHLRSFKIDFSSLQVNDSIDIADLNIILLSSVANFGDASATRVGKLEGVVDKVFGQLEGYGAYLQKIYASHAAHISGTLTAGDENGFGATFYAGKIHRNSFVNSLEISFASEIIQDNISIINPTGIGNIYRSDALVAMNAQSNEWLVAHEGKRYCFSFWVYAKSPCQLGIVQNGKVVGNIQVSQDQTHEWRRVHASFTVLPPENIGEQMLISISPEFQKSIYDIANVLERNIDENVFYFTAPQLETGDHVTQYQPTDSQLNYTDDYGAWFARGGIGGTIQNPLLKFNKDGSISSRNDSFVIKPDGTGYFANGRFKWDSDTVSLSGMKIKWEDFDDETQGELKPKSIQIIGENVFIIDGKEYAPKSIELSAVETNFTANPENITWHYLRGGNEYVPFAIQSGRKITIKPEEEYWNGQDTLTIKCVVLLNQNEYVDTITIQKSRHGEDAYSVSILTSNGNIFKNGIGSTDLVAHVYRGGVEITNQLYKKDFDWIKTSSNPNTDRIFNASHIGWGNVLTITSDDVWNMAQFDCKIRIN